MNYDEVGGSIHMPIAGDFADSAESVQLDFSDLRGSFPTQTIPASSVATCN
ncbi:MAG: hypothetical protein OES21_09300 [Myxococcales bacterium]|jgi:hypothetical protein|nr:hypothetical protein [Myxococcales bacterium]